MSGFERRTQALQQRLADATQAGIVVSDLLNTRYLTGFTGSNALLLVPAEGDCIFLTDARYRDQARAEVWVPKQVIAKNLLAEAKLRDLSGWVAETHLLSVKDWRDLGELADAGRHIEALRLTKDDSEIEALRTAAEISVQALRTLLTEPLVGSTERELALRLEILMREFGAEDRAFDTIVASGVNSAIPHHRPTSRPIGNGDLLKIDFGAMVNGYRADCTRTMVMGAASDWQREIHAAVREAQSLGVSLVKPDTPIADIDTAVRANLAQAGWDKYFSTGLGHGVGLLIHEDPFLSSQAVGRIERRMVLTMEPGIYLPDRGGVRIEDMVLVSETGPEVLTDMTTELMEIG